jgi:hypothetical protein
MQITFSPNLTTQHHMYLLCCCSCAQSNLVKQLGKLVKVRYVEDITKSKRVGEWQETRGLGDTTGTAPRTRKCGDYGAPEQL